MHFTLANPNQIRVDQLVHEILQATGVNVRPACGYEPPQTVTLALDLTAGQVRAIEQLAGKTPEEAYGLIENALTGASTVAEMRQVLIQLLPVIGAGVVYLAREME